MAVPCYTFGRRVPTGYSIREAVMPFVPIFDFGLASGATIRSGGPNESQSPSTRPAYNVVGAGFDSCGLRRRSSAGSDFYAGDPTRHAAIESANLDGAPWTQKDWTTAPDNQQSWSLQPGAQNRWTLQQKKDGDVASLSHNAGTCYRIRAYIFRRNDGHAPEMVGSTTCGPRQAQAKNIRSPKPRLIPAN